MKKHTEGPYIRLHKCCTASAHFFPGSNVKAEACTVSSVVVVVGVGVATEAGTLTTQAGLY